MRYPLTAVLLFLTAALSAAAPPEVKFPELAAPTPAPITPKPATPVATVTPDRLFVVESKTKVTLKGSTLAGQVDIKAVPGPFTVYAKFADGPDRMELKTFAGPHVFLITPVKAGDCELFVVPEKWETADDIRSRTIRVETGEGPKPPPHVDPVEPAPIPDKGFRVLIVYETSDLAKLPAAQTAVLTSAEVRGYLNDKCVAGPDGKNKEWRVFDKDTDVSRESKLWQAAMKRERKSVPWIVVSNGTTGFEGPLPANIADTLVLLKKYGGN